MSDLISRKALIDTIEKNCYPIRYDRCSEENGMTVTGIMRAINEQPTAFDLENVIGQLEEKAIEELGIDKSQFSMDRGEYSSYCSLCLCEVEEILKSAANATNGKNGG